jgi:hypothetical protein
LPKGKGEKEMTTICCYCKKVIKFGPEFTKDLASMKASHGACKECEKVELEKLDRREESKNGNKEGS